MKKNKKLMFAIIALLLVASAVTVVFVFTVGSERYSDACTKEDWANFNCVPAGHCGPEGSLVDQTIDCKTKNYDSKFCHDSSEVCKNIIY